ncbi:MAG: iron-containing alcohol dehydrogenase [Thermoplasmata archaeon]
MPKDLTQIISDLVLDWENPKRIVFGRGQTKNLGSILNSYMQVKSAVIVTDENIEKAGILEKVTSSVNGTGIKTDIFKIPVHEPDMETANNVANYAHSKSFDAVIGVGGGSAMDMGKLMAMMKTNPGKPLDYCALPPDALSEKVKNRPVPEILIPTTAGTGSEQSNTLVIIENGYKTWITSNKLYATIALVDPENTYTTPPNATRSSGVDAMSHLLEGLVSSLHNPVSDGTIIEGVKLVYDYLPRSYNNGNDVEARTALSLASTMGGWVLGLPWVGGPATIGHCLSEGFGPKLNIPHGLACGLMLPHVIDFNRNFIGERMKKVLIAIEPDEDYFDFTIQEAIDALIQKIVDLLKAVEINPAVKYNTKESKDTFFNMIDYVLNERQYLYNLPAYNPRRLTKDNLTNLFEDIWEGKFSINEF